MNVSEPRPVTPAVIAIVGPTASGKSAVALSLALALKGEIVSADSMQVYTGMDIGTAKPSPEEQALVRHHMVDVARPDELFSVARFQELAEKAIADIWRRGRLPVVAGGTGLYIDALLRGFLFPDQGRNAKVRAQLEAQAGKLGVGALHRRLCDIDPEAASKIHPNDLRRIVRALEVHSVTGSPISELQRKHQGEPKYRARLFGLTMSRDLLAKRISARVDLMVEQGLLEEVRTLLGAGYGPELTSMQAIGYKEFAAYLRGEAALDEALEQLKTGTRRYAKRQMTWFRRNPDIIWVDVGDFDGPDHIAQYIIHSNAAWLEEVGYELD